MTDKKQLINKLIGKSLDFESPVDEYTTVAQLNTTEINGLRETVDKNTALISASLVNKIKVTCVNPSIQLTGVNYDKEFTYKPSFWLCLSEANGLKKAEPLVVSWGSGNHTILNIDQGFVSTFKLLPRLLSDKIFWDDLSKPTYEIVQNKLLSEYNFPLNSEAFVKIKKNYLEDYLYLRKKVAVQLFTINKEIIIDNEVLELLNEEGYYEEDFNQFHILIRKYNHRENIGNLEINGYKVLFEKDDTPEHIQESFKGHIWKGVEGFVTQWRATHEMPFQYVYVSDEVLAKYEIDDDYKVYPQNGSVSYKNQWSVSHCERVGKNAIKIEIKKLYEGNRHDVIDYWNKFSIDFNEIIEGENIAEKAKKLTRKYFLFGHLFSKLINNLFGFNFSASNIITLNEEQIENTGWSEFSDYNFITHRVNLKLFSKEQFISRCKKLYVLLGENLNEKSIREVVDYLGFSKTETKEIRSIKLLDLIVKYLNVARISGLDVIEQKETIVERVKEQKDFKFLSQLSAINNIRQLDAHKSGDTKLKLHSALKELNIESSAISNNYANACEQVYESLNKMFIKLNALLSEAINLNKQ